MKPPRVSARLAAAALALLSSPAFADVWVADRAALYKIDSTNPQVVLSVPAAKTIAVAVDGRDGAVWTLSDSSLTKRTASGVQVAAIDLTAIDMSGAIVLAIDGKDGSIWIGEGGGSLAGQSKSIAHLDQNGAVLTRITSPGGIAGLAVALDQSVWVLGKSSLYHYARAGTLLASTDLQPLVPGEPKLVSVDSVSGRLLIAGERRVLRVDARSPSSGSVLSPLPASADAIAVDEVGSTFYILAAGVVYPVGPSGVPGVGVDLFALGISGASTIAFDPASQSLILGSTAGVTRLTRQVSSPAAVALSSAVQALGVSPLTIRPVVAILAPQAGSLTRDARPAFSIRIDTLCSGNPCSVPQGYTLDASLNGQAVGSSFIAGGSPNTYTYTPPTRLPEGLNAFSASAIDASGQPTAPVSISFTIDSTPPAFLALAPISPTFTNQAAVTVFARLSEAVTLRSGPDVIPISPDGSFSFTRALAEGANAIDLLATDPAGNTVTASLSVTRDTVAPAFSNVTPANGSTVSNPSVVIAGSVSETATITLMRNGATVTSSEGQGFSFPISLSSGANDFLLVAADRAGNQASYPLRVTLGSSIQLTIVSPVSGASIGGSKLLVTGTFQADKPVGVVVNGTAATITGNQFTAQTTLAPGTNTVTATATSIAGEVATASVSITSTGGPEVIFTPATGIAPHEVEVIMPSGYFIAIDYDGNGTNDELIFGGGGTLRHTYPVPGTYSAKVLMADNANNTYNLTIPIVVHDVRALDQAIRSTFDRLLERMRANDLEGALQTFTPSAAAKYRPVFERMGAGMPQAADQLGAIADGSITEGIAEYLLVQQRPSGTQGFLIYLLQGPDGVWRISSL